MADDLTYHEHVAASFCKALGPEWSFVRHADPPAPDCVIAAPALRVGLELGRYRGQGPLNERQDQDWKLRELIGEEWLGDSSINHCWVLLQYREDHAGRAVLPPESRWLDFSRELRDTIRRQLPSIAPDADSFDLVFLDEIDFPRPIRAGVRPGLILPASHAPLVSSSCRAVLVSRCSEVLAGVPSSSLCAFWGGVDREEVQRLVRKKAKKSADYSTEPGMQRWLLLHSDGLPQTTTLLDKSSLHAALSEASSTLRAEGHAFDNVWWMNGTFSNAPTLHKLHPSDTP